MANLQETKIAEEVIDIRNAELSRQQNFRNLWQDTADWILPMFGKIQTQRTPGDRLGVHLADITARTEARNMASGLSAQIIPPDQQFFELQAADQEERDDGEIEEYLAQTGEDFHSILFDSNFKEEFDGSLQSLVVFGNAALYPSWTFKRGLAHRCYPIGSYQLRENEDGVIDTIIFTVKRTARQLWQRYGNKIGPHVRDALNAMNLGVAPQFDTFDVIQIIRPREDPGINPRHRLGMAWQSLHVGVMDKNILEEGGFPVFPYAVPRWWRSPGEIYGRGQGTEILPQITKLNQMELDVTDSGNMWVRPPLEILESFDGEVNMSASALHHVIEPNTIRAVDLGARGAYPVGKDILEDQREIIREAFMKNTLEQISSLKGDRRTTVEIFARLKEGFKKLSQPIGRVFTELLTPDLSWAFRLLLENGQLMQPPAQLTSLKIKYTGPLALALQDQHVSAFDVWLDLVTRMEEISPGTTDNVDFDESARDLGRMIGVKEAHIKPKSKRDAERRQRQQQQEDLMQLEATQAAAQAYGQTTKAPEPGSAAEELSGVL